MIHNFFASFWVKTQPSHTSGIICVTATLGCSQWLNNLAKSIDKLNSDIEWRVVSRHLPILTTQRKGMTYIEEDLGGNGLYGALNQACAFRPEWRWFTYINDDDLLLEGIDELIDLHCRPGNERIIAFGKVSMINEDGETLYNFPTTDRICDFTALWRQGVTPLTQQGMFVSKLVWDTLGGFDDSYRYSGDLDFWIRAHLAGFKFKYYNIPVASWRIRSGQLSSNHVSVLAESEKALKPVLTMPCSWKSATLALTRFRLYNASQYFRRFCKLGRIRQSSVFK